MTDGGAASAATRPTKTFDVFVVYADHDRAWVEGSLLVALRQGTARVATRADIQPGEPEVDGLSRLVRQSTWQVIVASPAWQADNLARLAALLANFHGRQTDTWPVIPVTLEPVATPSNNTSPTFGGTASDTTPVKVVVTGGGKRYETSGTVDAGRWSGGGGVGSDDQAGSRAGSSAGGVSCGWPCERQGFKRWDASRRWTVWGEIDATTSSRTSCRASSAQSHWLSERPACSVSAATCSPA